VIEAADWQHRDRIRLQGRDPEFEAQCGAEVAAADRTEWDALRDENLTLADVLEFRPRAED
jgi:predicted NAD-dependent protein-ADP-ribosyltransferase YbiA (DUF1768 family)